MTIDWTRREAGDFDPIQGKPRGVDWTLVEQMRKEEPEFCKTARQNYLRQEISRRKFNLAADAAWAKASVLDEGDLCFLRSCYQDDLAKVRRLESELERLARPVSDDRLTEAQIEEARQYSLARFLDKKIGDKIICPSHEDKNASGHLYTWGMKCFSCGAALDTIGYLQKVQGLSFIAAVRSLI